MSAWRLAATALLMTALCGAQPAAAQTSAAAQTAGGISDPVRFIKAALGFDKASTDRPSAPEMLDQDRPEYTPRLRALFALQRSEEAKDEVGRLDMNIWTGTQDDDIKTVDVTSVDVERAAPPRRVVTAKYVNMGHKTVMHYYFEKIGDKWFLDDISTPGDGTPDGMPGWTLSLILKFGWDY